MIILDSTTKSLQLVLASAAVANQLSCVAAWADLSGTTITPGASDAQSNDATPVTIVAAPASGAQRQLKSLDIYNADTAAATVSAVYNNGGTLRTLVSITLQPNETLQLAENAWSVIDSNGKLRTSASGSSSSSGSGSGSSAGPNVTITTTGSSFSPLVELASGSTATVTWTSSDGVTATGLSPTLTFSDASTRTVEMAVTDSGGSDAISQVVTFNLGFDSTDDAGDYNIGSSYDKSPEAVSGIENTNSMTGLQIFAAADITTLTATLDFTGMSSLQYIECFGSRVQTVNVTGCTSLIRLCMEQNDLSELNLNPIAANVFDVRGAAQQGGALTLTPLASRMPQDYHFCVRDETITNMPDFSDLTAIKQLWIWNTGQSGALATSSSALADVRAYSNAYTSADFTDQFTSGSSAYLDLHSNSLTSVTLTGCTALGYIDLSDNDLDQSAVDTVLNTVNSWDTSSGTLNLSSNTAPSSTGQTYATALQGRGWTVTVDASGGGGGGGEFTHADTAIATGTSTSLAATLSATVGSGDLLVVGMHASTAPTVTDGAGNTWTVVNVSSGAAYLAYCLSSTAASGGDAITATVPSGNSVTQMATDRFTYSGTASFGGAAGTGSSGTLGLNYNSTGCGDLGTVPASALAWGTFLCSSGSGDQSYSAGYQSGSSGTVGVIGSQVANTNGTGVSVYVSDCTNSDATLTWYGTGTGAIGTALSAYFTLS